jgi:hypothetical protein
MVGYRTDRDWSDLMIPQIKQIVGPHLIQESNLEADIQQATDLMILSGRDIRIAARVRRPGYLPRFKYDFTIRSRRESGAETEFSKIIEGWGDWLFYGHAEQNSWISVYWIIDLRVFRAELIRTGPKLLGPETANGDGTFFIPCDVRKFPTRMLIGSSEPLSEAAA